MDRHRADARGGRGHQLDRPGRDRPCPGPLRAARDADRRRRRPDRLRPRRRTPTATPRCSTTRAATGPSPSRGATCTRRPTPCGWRRWRAALAPLARAGGQDAARGDIPPACTPTPGSGAWPTAAGRRATARRTRSTRLLAGRAGRLRATRRRGGAPRATASCRSRCERCTRRWQARVSRRCWR